MPGAKVSAGSQKWSNQGNNAFTYFCLYRSAYSSFFIGASPRLDQRICSYHSALRTES